MRSNKTNKIQIQEHGLMLADYFHGTSGVWLNLYPTPETTKGEALEELKAEIDLMFEHIVYTAISNDWNMGIYEGPNSLLKQIDTQIQKMENYIKDKENELLCGDMEYDNTGDAENPAYIFSIEFIEE